MTDGQMGKPKRGTTMSSASTAEFQLAISRLEEAIDRLDSLGLARAAVHVSLGLEIAKDVLENIQNGCIERPDDNSECL